MDKIYINRNMKSRIAKNEKFDLKKVSTKGLIATIGFLAAVGLMIGIIIKEVEKKDYKSHVETFSQLADTNFTEQYMSWLNDEKGEDITISNEIAVILDKAVPEFYSSKNKYEDYASVAEVDDVNLVDARVGSISSVNKLKNASIDILKLELRKDFSLGDNAIINIFKDDNTADGRSYRIVIEDNGVKYVMSSNAIGDKSIPDKYLDVVESYYNIDKYQGDGSNSQAWDKETTQKYLDSAESLLYNLLQISFEKEKLNSKSF